MLLPFFRKYSPRLWGIHTIMTMRILAFRFIPTPVGHTYLCQISTALPPVHPHACGAYIHCTDLLHTLHGSSPRLWGILARHIVSAYSLRFIPTPVGHTFLNAKNSAKHPVHPHACGAYIKSKTDIQLVNRFIPTPVGHTSQRAVGENDNLGSSPRLWGIPIRYSTTRRQHRFIPTPVGHTAAESCLSSALAVHPHACGAYERNTLDSNTKQRFIPTPVGHTQ